MVQAGGGHQVSPDIDFADPKLFGNDAADFEDLSTFLSYVLTRDEVGRCQDPSHLIAVARAYKGEGKSALLRLITYRLSNTTSSHVIVNAIGPDISPAIESLDPDIWARNWKKNILGLVAREVGSKIEVAFGDDAISLVEEAETNGFKERSFIGSILDRLVPTGIGVDRKKPAIVEYEQTLRRHAKYKAPIWIIVDDVDQNFANSDRNRVKVASFFTACRQLIASIPELRFRLSIRPNVWTIVKREFESLSHIEQYVFDLHWTDTQFRSLLAQRIASYLARTGQADIFLPRLPTDPVKREDALVNMVFSSTMNWGNAGKARPPYKVLHTMARHRPRWMVELCKQAGISAKKAGHNRILLTDLKENLSQFGQKRIEDLSAEFRSMCPQLEDIVAAFSGQTDLFTTTELLATIQSQIIDKVGNLKIVGVMGSPTALSVAHFLFQIGFISARKDYGYGEYDHFFYTEKPHLLASETNIDDGCNWEIHIAFRQVLNLRHYQGRPSRHG